MKFVFHEFYSKMPGEKNVYIGLGEVIKIDIKDYLQYKVKEIRKLSFNGFLFVLKLSLENDFKFHLGTYYQELKKEGTDKAIKELSVLLGPLGRNDFKRYKDDYLCARFTFEEEWFMYEASKINSLFQSYDDLYMKNSINDSREKEKFFRILSDCMENVRPVQQWDTKRQEVKTIYQPLNLFGSIALEMLNMFNKDIGNYKCKICGETFFMKRDSSHICKTCQNARRQRRKNIKEDFEIRKLSLDEVIAKRKSATKEEIIEVYTAL